MSEPAIILTLKSPPSLNKLWITTGRGRVRSPEYRAWLRDAGWEVRQQMVGVPRIDIRYDMEIQVPVSMRDSGNWEKAIGDLLQSVGVVANDGNVNDLSVRPIGGRTDCGVALTLRPDLGQIRPPPKPVIGPKRRRSSSAMVRVTGPGRLTQ